MYDIYGGFVFFLNWVLILIIYFGDWIGDKFFYIFQNKIVVIIEIVGFDCNILFKLIDDDFCKIVGFLFDFYDNEVKQGCIFKNLLLFQFGVGNILNVVFDGLFYFDLEYLILYIEVIQDGMIDFIDVGKFDVVFVIVFLLLFDYVYKMNENVVFYCDYIILCLQEILNYFEVICCFGVIGVNGMIEVDIYGNVNLIYVMGLWMMNGIGGFGDFICNVYILVFVFLLIVKGGVILVIVLMVFYVDYIEYDGMVIIIE